MTPRGRPAPVLARGRAVGIVAPGFAVRPGALEKGIRRLETMGYEVVRARHLLSREGYFAGADAERALDLNRMIRDPLVRAIWFARGGYGTARLLDAIDWRALARDPKLLVGYSDLTSLFSAVGRRTGQVCLHGPLVTDLGDAGAYDGRSLRAMLAGRAVTLRIPRGRVMRQGRAEGRVVGGNLSVLVHLLGTRHAPDFRGAVLFLEEAGEAVYRIDRMLNHLRMAGALRALAAVLLGGFDPIAPRRRFPPDRSLDDLFRESFLPLGIPVVTGIPAGHVRGKWTIPINGIARVDTGAGRLELSPIGR